MLTTEEGTPHADGVEGKREMESIVDQRELSAQNVMMFSLTGGKNERQQCFCANVEEKETF